MIDEHPAISAALGHPQGNSFACFDPVGVAQTCCRVLSSAGARARCSRQIILALPSAVESEAG